MDGWRDLEAFEPWTPRLVDVMKQFPDWGFGALEFDREQNPLTAARWDTLKERFFERYALRRVNQETLARWQLRLQNRLDEIIGEFERAYRLYHDYAAEMDKNVIDGARTESHGVGETSATDKSETRAIDTPDKAINHDKNYADRLTESDAHHGEKNTSVGLTIHKKTGSVVMNVNTSIDGYRDIDTEFIKCFENNFLNILWE